jgi:hypothetical protein
LPDYLQAGGLVNDINELRNDGKDCFTLEEKLVLQLCEQMTFGNQVDDGLKR